MKPDTQGDGDGDTDGDSDGDSDGDEIDTLRVLVVMNQSTSLQCTDPELLRRTIVQAYVDDLRGDPRVSIGYIGFHATIYDAPFTTPNEFEIAFSETFLQLGPATDYQGALTAVANTLEADISSFTAEELARTRYQILFHSDGIPEPVCTAGCEDDDRSCSDGVDNDGDGDIDDADPSCDGTFPNRLYGVCNTDETIPDDVYIDFDGHCGGYNTSGVILDRVGEILSLATTHGVGELSLDTILLFTSQELVDANCGGSGVDLGYVWTEATTMLEAIAFSGGGTFTDLFIGDRDDPPDGEPVEYPYECDNRFSDCGAPGE